MRITRVGTVVAVEDLPSARVLQASLAAHAPGVTLTALALPGAFTEARRTLGEAGARVLRLRDMRGATHPGLTASSPGVQRRVMAPALLRHLLGEEGAAAALLPVDGALFGPLGALERALSAGSSFVVVPRFSGSLPDDGKRPDAADLDRLGPVDPDVAAAAAGAEELLEWWLAREVERHDLGRHGRGTRTPAPGTPLAAAGRAFPGVAACEDPGLGVSPWNLHQRPLGRAADGTLTAAGEPLALMRFPGFRPDRPWWLSDGTSRVEVLEDPVLSELLRSRAEELERAGWRAPEHKDGDLGELIHRVHVDERLRELQAEAHFAGEDFGGLDDPVAREAFLRWLVVPVRGRLNTYALRVYRERPDVSAAHADLDDPGVQAAFVRWLWDHGRHEMQLPDALLPPPDPGTPAGPLSTPSVLVLGYLRGRLGLGQAGRGTASALRAAGAEVTTHAVALDAERAPFDPPAASGPGARDDAAEHAGHAYEGAAEAVAAADVVVVSVNAPQLPGVLGAIGPEPFAGRYVVGQWAWEASTVPNGWEQAFDAVDEVWVYSSYVADVISRASTKPVVVVPLPVEVPDEWAEPSVELPPGEFMFLFAFDLLSTIERKNPLGTIEAYRRAFGPDEGSTLVVKTVGGTARPQELAALRAAAADRPDIAIVDASLPAAEMAGLMRRADAYVSLHRSEGFGLTPAEAMALGKPVIATRFGGNLDFMHPENSLLVDFELRRIGPDAEHYPADGVWAEPSVEHAAALMRSVREDPSRAARLGARAQREIAERLSPRAVGVRALERLSYVTSLRTAARPDGPDALGLDALEQAVSFDLEDGGEGPRGALRRAVLRVLRPYAVRRRQADLEMTRVLRSLAWQLDRLEAARERDRDRIARLERRIGD